MKLSVRSGLVRLVVIFLITLTVVIASPAIARLPQTSQPLLLAQSSSLLEQGKIYYQTGKFAEAIQVLQEAIQAYGQDWPNQALALNNLGLVYLETGKLEAALETWRQAERAYEKVGDRSGMMRCRIQQAQAHQALGEVTRALDILTELKRQTDKQPASLEKVRILRLMGDMLLAIGGGNPDVASPQMANLAQDRLVLPTYLQPAEKILQDSLALATQLNAADEISEVNISLGNVAHAALKTNIRIDITDKPSSENKIKAALALQPQVDLALQYYEKGSQAQQSTTIVRSQIGVLNLLISAGQAYKQVLSEVSLAQASQVSQIQAKLNQISVEVLNLMIKVAPQLESLPLSRTGVYARINFADTLSKLWRTRNFEPFLTLRPLPVEIQVPRPLPESAEILAVAINQAQQLGDRRAEAYGLGVLGSLYEKNEQWQNAERLTRQAIFLAQSINAPDITYQWQHQLGRILSQQAQQDPTKAEESKLAYHNALQTLAPLRSSLAAINPDVQFDFRDSVAPIYRDYIKLLLKGNERYGQPSQDDLKKAREQLENLQLAELDNFFREACLTGRKDYIDKQIDDNPANAKTAVIYPIILSKRELAVIAKLPKQPDLYYARVGSDQITEDIDVTLSQFQKELRDGEFPEAHKRSGQIIYNWLFSGDLQQVLEKNQVNTLVFVLDGAFRSVPMAALYDGSEYLVQRTAIAVSPGLQLTAPEETSTPTLQVFAGVLSQLAKNYPKLDGQPFNEIKGSVEQMNRLRELKVLTAELQEQEFTSANFQKQVKTSDFNVIHLVTHGIFSSRLEDTFILMADQATNGRVDAKRFSEILRSRGQTTADVIDLLVLSACQTAQGDDRAALGLAGIAMRSGARSTIAGLWGVFDTSAVSLFNQFYTSLQEQQLTKAKSLQEAQKAMIQNGKPANQWAPFVLVGNWL